MGMKFERQSTRYDLVPVPRSPEQTEARLRRERELRAEARQRIQRETRWVRFRNAVTELFR